MNHGDIWWHVHSYYRGSYLQIWIFESCHTYHAKLLNTTSFFSTLPHNCSTSKTFCIRCLQKVFIPVFLRFLFLGLSMWPSPRMASATVHRYFLQWMDSSVGLRTITKSLCQVWKHYSTYCLQCILQQLKHIADYYLTFSPLPKASLPATAAEQEHLHPWTPPQPISTLQVSLVFFHTHKSTFCAVVVNFTIPNLFFPS